MVNGQGIGFHEGGLVTISLKDYMELHQENLRLSQENLQFRTVLESIKGIAERSGV